MKKAEVYNISTGQYQSSMSFRRSGLLGKTTNIQNTVVYYCKIIKGSYILWHGKVWLLRKINRKKEKDHTMIILCHVCSFPEAWWFEVRLTRAFIRILRAKSSHVGCPDDLYVMDHVVVFVPLTAPRFPLHLVSLLSGLTLSSLDIFYNLDHRDDGEG